MLVADPRLIASPVVLAPNWYASEPCSTASVQNASSNGIQVQPLAPAMAVPSAREMGAPFGGEPSSPRSELESPHAAARASARSATETARDAPT